MKETATMKYETRSHISKGANNLLRRNGFIPGIISGRGMTSVPVAVKKDELRKSLKEHGRNAVFTLVSSDNNSFTVMVKEISITPIINEYSHVDFQQVSLSSEIKTDVTIRYLGTELLESKRLLLNRQIDMIPVTGLPQNVPDAIEIDVSNMKAGEQFKVSDIKLPDGISTDITPEQVIASIGETKVQEVVEEEQE